ncbi:MAG: NusG domain II-containing protein [Nitrospirae bacterium]|nr:MAG: NusG domain II-containing protein [Nitrospirota bacterium]
MRLLALLKDTRPLDWLILVLLIVIAASSLLYAKGLSSRMDDTVVVELNGKVVYRLSLRRDAKLMVKGPLGNTRIVISDGRVRVTDSPCPEKICVRQGWVKRGVIVCVPNRVVVTVGTQHRTVDAITG